MEPSKSGIEARFRLDWPGFSLDVNLALAGRGVSALFGPSGSGKTTLLRCIAGLERAPAGRLVVNGEVWQDEATWMPTWRRPIGYVFQEASLFSHLSVRGNLDYGRKRSRGRGDALDQAIGLLGIGMLLDRSPERLSGGEKSRVAIARALALAPRLLLLDEPLAALDLKRKQEILPYLEKLHDELAIPVIYVSHSADEVARLADDLVVIDSGRVIAHGELAATLARIDLPIRLGEDAGVVIDTVLGERDLDWHLARVDFAGGSLWVRDSGLAPGSRARVRILARDVSIARERIDGTSIQNTLPATVVAIADDAHPAHALVRLEVGEATGTALVARLTRRSAAALELAPGRAVWAQIKSVALVG